MADYFPDGYFPPGYFPPGYFGGASGGEGTHGGLYAALMGSSALAGVLTAREVFATYGAGGRSLGAIPLLRPLLRPTLKPLLAKSRLRGKGRLAASASAVANATSRLDGASSVAANATATAHALTLVSGAATLSARLTGVFDFLTDDNNFWLLAA